MCVASVVTGAVVSILTGNCGIYCNGRCYDIVSSYCRQERVAANMQARQARCALCCNVECRMV